MKLIVHPTTSIDGVVRVPGDKSVTHRALLFGAISNGTTEIVRPGLGEDNFSTYKVIQSLGAEASHPDAEHFWVRGVGLHGLRASDGPLDCGNSGTTARLLAGLLAGAGVEAELIGDESLSVRPMRRVADPLNELGYDVSVSGAKGTLPLRTKAVEAQMSDPVRAVLQVASAQVKSCILLSGLYRSAPTEVIEPAVSRDHTERMLRVLGARVESSMHYVDPSGDHGETMPYCRLQPVRELRARSLEVPGDLSSAAFLLCAGALRGPGVTVRGVGTNPTRTGLLAVFERMGAGVTQTNRTVLSSGEPAADLVARPATLRATTISGAEIPLLIDEIPVLCVLGAASTGRFEIRDAAELRVKESDRIEKTADILRGMGVDVTTYEDGLSFDGLGEASWSGFEVDAAGDHRIALAAAIAGLAAREPVEILNAEAIAVSYPEFAATLKELGVRTEEVSS